jgi:hypothetical protein
VEIDDSWGIDNPERADNQHWVLALLQGHLWFGCGLTELKRVPAPEPLKFTVVPKNPDHDLRAARFHIFCLRMFVDNWIESGREGTAEDPLKRRLSIPLTYTLHHWSSQKRPALGFRVTGQATLYIPGYRDANTEFPFRNAWNESVRLFAQLLDSPYRYRIAKCRRDGCTYYYTKRVPKGPLHYGTYCPVHRQKASAKRSEYRKRNAIHENRIKIANSLWGRWPPEIRSEKSQRLWLVAELNRKQSKAYPEIKINWVTRHLKEITAEHQANTEAGR